MSASADHGFYARVVDAFFRGSKLLRAYPLPGGVSAQVTALEVEHPGGKQEKLLLRQHGEMDRRANPHIAWDEYRLLNVLQTVGLPSPSPYYVDESGILSAIPYLIIEYIEGQTEFAPADVDGYLAQFAEQLASIHQVDGARADLAFLPQRAVRFTRELSERLAQDASLDEGRVREVLEAAWPLPRRNASALLHGDYWPGNLLWRDGALVGVIDWEDAGIGDPLVDVGNSRLEILWAFGADAMRAFTEHYRAFMTLDWASLPYWDLCAALRLRGFAKWAADAHAEQAMREGYRWFVTQAFDKLAM